MFVDIRINKVDAAMRFRTGEYENDGNRFDKSMKWTINRNTDLLSPIKWDRLWEI